MKKLILLIMLLPVCIFAEGAAEATGMDIDAIASLIGKIFVGLFVVASLDPTNKVAKILEVIVKIAKAISMTKSK